jgi:hypothetical protein
MTSYLSLIVSLSLSLPLPPVAPTLEHGASMKSFFHLSFLILDSR